MVDRSRLVKLLNMTDSQHDAEALSAIRRSNDLLRRSNTSWAELLILPDQPELVSQRKPELRRDQRHQRGRLVGALTFGETNRRFRQRHQRSGDENCESALSAFE
jgi:hypothetical protein